MKANDGDGFALGLLGWLVIDGAELSIVHVALAALVVAPSPLTARTWKVCCPPARLL